MMDNNGQSSSIGTSWDTDVVNPYSKPSPILSDTVQLIKWANTEVISIYNIVDVAGRQCNLDTFKQKSLAIKHWDSMGQNGMVLY